MLINCDLGEALIPNPDPKIMPHIQLANIACGGHAGDKQTLLDTLSLAKLYNIKIGAHPSYPDKANFGRKVLEMSWPFLQASLNQQVNLLLEVCGQLGLTLHHIKPHGALYNQMMRDITLYEQLLDWMKQHFSGIYLVIQGGIQPSTYQALADHYQVPLLKEGFADRGYLADGRLKPRTEPNSLYQEPDAILSQGVQFSLKQQFDTLCFHSDNPASVEALARFTKLKRLLHVKKTHG